MKKFALTASLWLAACGGTNPHVRDTMEFHKKMISFEKGKSTKNDILREAGEPDRKENVDGKEAWVYWRQQLAIFEFPFYVYYTGKKNADTYYRFAFDDGIMTKMGIATAGYGYSKELPEAIVRPER